MDEMMDFQFTKILVNDFEIGFSGSRDYGAFLEVKRMPGVDAEPMLNVACKLRYEHHEKKLAVNGLIPGSQLTIPVNTEGKREPLPEVGLLLSHRLAGRFCMSLWEMFFNSRQPSLGTGSETSAGCRDRELLSGFVRLCQHRLSQSVGRQRRNSQFDSDENCAEQRD
ncbi:MAG: hypothetical protein R3C11_08755 [Planctomycetaceae bacterium]